MKRKRAISLYFVTALCGFFFAFPSSASAAISLSVEPKHVSLSGQTSTLSWGAPNGATCQSYADVLNEKGQWVWTLSDQWQSAKRAEKGTVLISPERSTRYSISCVLNDVTESASVVVSVGASDVTPAVSDSVPAEKPKSEKKAEESQSVVTTDGKKLAEQKVPTSTGGGGGGASAALGGGESGTNTEPAITRDSVREKKESLEKTRTSVQEKLNVETEEIPIQKDGAEEKKAPSVEKKPAAKIVKKVISKKTAVPVSRTSTAKKAPNTIFTTKKTPAAKIVKKPVLTKKTIKKVIERKQK